MKMKKFENRGFTYIGIEGNCSVFQYKGRKISIPTGALSSGYVNSMLRKLPTLERSAERIRTGDLNSLVDEPRYQGRAVWDLVRVSIMGTSIRRPNTYMLDFIQQFSGLTLSNNKGV